MCFTGNKSIGRQQSQPTIEADPTQTGCSTCCLQSYTTPNTQQGRCVVAGQRHMGATAVPVWPPHRVSQLDNAFALSAACSERCLLHLPCTASRHSRSCRYNSEQCSRADPHAERSIHTNTPFAAEQASQPYRAVVVCVKRERWTPNSRHSATSSQRPSLNVPLAST